MAIIGPTEANVAAMTTGRRIPKNSEAERLHHRRQIRSRRDPR